MFRNSPLSMLGQWLWLPIVLSAMAAIYLPGLENALIYDDRLLGDDQLFVDYGSLAELKPRLLSYGSFVWVRDWLGEGWWKQRLFNLAVHVGVVFALWAFYRELLRHVRQANQPGPGTLGSGYANSLALGPAIGFFALNPVAVYAVAYLIQRSILMATLFVVVGLYCFVRALGQGRRWLYPAAVLCYLLAVLSKEHAVLAPLAALPLYVLVARPTGRKLAGIAALLVLLAGIAILLLTLRYGEIIGKPFDDYSRIYLTQLESLRPGIGQDAYLLSIVNQLYAFFKYGWHWLIPNAEWMSINLRPPYPLTLASYPQILGLFGYAGVLLGGGYLLMRYRDGRALLGVSLLIPALLFASEFATVWVQDPFVLYRSYLWAIGLPGLLIFLLHGIPGRALLVVGLAGTGIGVWQGLDRIHSLATPERAWTDAIVKQSNDARAVGRWFAYLNRGTAYVDHSRHGEALQDFAAASTLGDGGMGMHNAGALLFLLGRNEESLRALDKAESQGCDLYSLYYHRGMALLKLGKPAEAAQAFDIALGKPVERRVRPRIMAARGRAAMEQGRAREAIRYLDGSLAKSPDLAEARLSLGMAYVMEKRHAEARDLFTAMLRVAEGGEIYYGRALANHGLGRKQEALDDIERAIRLEPGNQGLQAWRAKMAAMP